MQGLQPQRVGTPIRVEAERCTGAKIFEVVCNTFRQRRSRNGCRYRSSSGSAAAHLYMCMCSGKCRRQCMRSMPVRLARAPF
mmetsp:Transcript_39561/g.99471  ORF Transcript_39561/g.99471 Transcript_39561/m.99471 type:complete len:82 (+) Transcript_39561:185-430(+)